MISDQLCSGESKSFGPKYNACNAFRCHPKRNNSSRFISLDDVVRFFALVLMSNRFKNFKALIVKLSSSPLSSKSLSGIQSGMFSDTYTTASVTSNVFDGL